jgi:hypothetical protein
MIGNLELPKDKYAGIKKKLLEEIREEARKTNRLHSLFEIVPNTKPKVPSVSVPEEHAEADIGAIDKAFADTFRVLFKKEPGGITKYEPWLARNTAELKKLRSPFGSTVYLARHPILGYASFLPENRIVSYAEGMELGRFHIESNDVDSLEALKGWLSDTACFCRDYVGGTTSNIIESTVIYEAANVYKCHCAILIENTGVSSWPMGSVKGRSKNLFGCHYVLNSQFCIGCYNSQGLNRCFQMDMSANCADSMFCHNSEGLKDSLFCFNANGKRTAIGNVVLSTDRYRGIRDSLTQQMADEIIRTKGLKWSVFNIGCYWG